MENLAGPSFPRSSLLLQGMIWLEDWVTMLLVSVVLVLLICKPFLYRYPPGLAASEFILMLCHVPVQAARSWLGTAGNKQERAMFVAAFLGLSSWTILVTGYFFLLQAYALYLESILAGTALALALFETLQGAWSGSSFCDGLLEFASVFLSFVAAAGSAALLYSLWPA
ncbi:unnamed protein product [Symbiodinium sp. CCMP2592]|nr:unnamed protein product [Symbiodinium sp. CCMP2592]